MPLLPASSMDFSDGAQRFNWCSCQPPAARNAGLSGAVVPIFDFNYWSNALTGGGGTTPAPTPVQPQPPQPAVSGPFGFAISNNALWIGGAVLLAWGLVPRGRRR